jgi:hypothetical protein
MDSFRGRSWISWHHHIALVATAEFLLLTLQVDLFLILPTQVEIRHE